MTLVHKTLIMKVNILSKSVSMGIYKTVEGVLANCSYSSTSTETMFLKIICDFTLEITLEDDTKQLLFH